MNKAEINRNKLKSVLKTNSWFLWVIPLFIFVSYMNGMETGLFLSGLMISGISLGMIIPVLIGAIFKKYDLKNVYGEIIIFVISTTFLWIYIPDKKLLAFMIPFSIPLIIIGLLNLRK
ncbi:hypothetical protein LY01_02149 [Nonlabens xylanidelens]|uniref:Uncharacterized protein n=1 Tax=Nonlabens xylanidelens TaxID=191564 RepID=A0A2S6II82_9FLAO|nr:hypothetical protein [Nonlabens xylanidelens]PPK93927.1 hypothetical protein LY01_02149 [Nonlabens xylanidelens]PQJ22083.1 hypothetical protein BST94_00460 [Nonlabens xylanidelens]